MIKELSAGAIIFFRQSNKIYYLLLRYPRLSAKSKKQYWGFAKGGIEEGETVTETVQREIKEETSLTGIKLLPGFKEEEKYYFFRSGRKIFKKVIFLLAEADTKKVRISEEHLDYKWLDYQNSLKQLTYDNARNILKKAHSFILANK